MSYAAPTIGASGLTIPSYNDIIAYYIAGYQNIYGQTTYVGNDAADVQLMSILALAAADGNNVLQAVYNNMSPAFATGGGLSILVALNGLTRKAASNSTCLVTLTGTPGAIIANGIIQNSATGDLWNLPSSVTIGGGGTVNVTATAQVAGAINALANQLTVITTPATGWTSVTNGSNVAAVGQPVETDSQLRQRQAVSTELPSETLLSGTIAAVLAVPGVTRINNSPVLGSDGTPSIENFTGSTDDWGNPAHSITVVVEGGTAADVATAIYNNRGIGVLTNGDVSGSPISQTVTVNVTDPQSGITIPISFIMPPVYVPIYVTVNAHVIAGGSLSASQVSAIRSGLANYLNALQIGEVVSFGELIQAASAAVNPNPANPTVSIRSPFYLGTSLGTSSTDVPMNFYQVAQGFADSGHIVVNSV